MSGGYTSYCCSWCSYSGLVAFLPRLVIKDGSWFSGKWVPYPVGLFRTFIIFLVRGFMPHIVIQGVSYSLASGVHTPICSSGYFMCSWWVGCSQCSRSVGYSFGWRPSSHIGSCPEEHAASWKIRWLPLIYHNTLSLSSLVDQFNMSEIMCILDWKTVRENMCGFKGCSTAQAMRP